MLPPLSSNVRRRTAQIPGVTDRPTISARRHGVNWWYCPSGLSAPVPCGLASLLKRWLLGTHQGAVSHDQLDYYLDEHTFRFNRRHSHHSGMLFHRLLEQAVATDPHPLTTLYSSKPETPGTA